MASHLNKLYTYIIPAVATLHVSRDSSDTYKAGKKMRVSSFLTKMVNWLLQTHEFSIKMVNSLPIEACWFVGVPIWAGCFSWFLMRLIWGKTWLKRGRDVTIHRWETCLVTVRRWSSFGSDSFSKANASIAGFNLFRLKFKGVYYIDS